MSILKFHRAISRTAIALASLAFSTHAIAQASYEEGMAQQRAQEAQIMEQSRIEAEYAKGDSGYDDGGASESSHFASRPPSMWADFIRQGRTISNSLEQDRMANNPAYRNLAKGVWTYISSEPRDEHPMCAATFWTSYGGVTMVHWLERPGATFIGFFGVAIPRPREIERDRITLTQSGEKQNVEAFLMRFPMIENLGFVLFAVPSANALIKSIEDRQDFQIEIKGKEVANGAWHSGLKARDALKKCMTAQSRRQH